MSIEAIGLTKNYGDFSVCVDFRVDRGETLVLAGPSGCGKTTALMMVAGLLPADAGSILSGGADVTAVPAWERRMGVVFQDLALFPHLDVGGNVGFSPFVRGMPRAERKALVEACLSAVRMEGYSRRRIATLSGGERQRIAIARALAARPGALLMDEPFSSLDAPLRLSLRSEVKGLPAREGIPCLFVTHDREEAASLATRIAVMDGGRIIEEGRPADLFRRPRTAFAARFLGAGAVVPPEALPGMDVREGSGGNVFVPHGASRLVPAGAAEARVVGTVEDVDFVGASISVKVALDGGGVLSAPLPVQKAPPERGSRVALAFDAGLLRRVAD